MALFSAPTPPPEDSDGEDRPRGYRRGLAAGALLWLALAAAGAGWLSVHAGETRADIEARTPQATAKIRTVYLTPQITDAAAGLAFDSAPTAATLGQGVYVSIVVTGLGLSHAETERAVEDLPAAIALAFSPYGDLEGWIQKAKDRGHEALALLPMEPLNFPLSDPGPSALLVRATEAENAKTLAGILHRGNGAAGVMNDMGGAFLKSPWQLAPVFTTLARAGAVFVEDGREGQTAARAEAEKARLPYLAADLAVDAGDATEAGVSQKLVDLERLAREKGHAIGLAMPYPVTFNMIKSWEKGLAARGVRLIPLADMRKVVERDAER